MYLRTTRHVSPSEARVIPPEAIRVGPAGARDGRQKAATGADLTAAHDQLAQALRPSELPEIRSSTRPSRVPASPARSEPNALTTRQAAKCCATATSAT